MKYLIAFEHTINILYLILSYLILLPGCKLTIFSQRFFNIVEENDTGSHILSEGHQVTVMVPDLPIARTLLVIQLPATYPAINGPDRRIGLL